ncbi:LppX_LprAFG lipoprotein [Mycobacterium tuberculosis]|nr:LppX_LprAFG lipoprotein [Mycobacterium tuberculosis]REM53557.1 LppX_LprAFG lipoprotein [Mycobacterium tuberculosis]REM69272.1 LppX_LprAFG lipoprotein [Mycobacterium tuberculosis]REQ32128.1 LppX_LprAFG lipoprotein [Mycobacterium tuberculosis]RER51235.1 LppX_LprAFG lipoprotein [Mycobacterium tuberculosis]
MNGLISQACGSHRPRRPSSLGAVAILIAATLFATVVAGCGKKPTTASSPSPGSPSPEAQQILQDSSKATKGLHSVHVVVTVNNLSTLPFESVDADVTNQPQGNGQAVGNAKVRMKPNTPVVATEFLVTNKTMYTKRGGDYVSVGPAEKIYDPGIILDKDRGLGAVVGQVQNPTIQGRDAIDGLATVKVSGTIDAAVIDPIVPQLGKGGGRLPITLWIVDTNASTPAPAANLVRMVIDKDQGNVDITLSNWVRRSPSRTRRDNRREPARSSPIAGRWPGRSGTRPRAEAAFEEIL